MNVIPCCSARAAKTAFSDRNPYPGWIAWQPVCSAACRIAPASRYEPSALAGPMQTDASACSSHGAPRSASEKTATDSISSFLAARITRRAISPRFAIKILRNIRFPLENRESLSAGGAGSNVPIRRPDKGADKASPSRVCSLARRSAKLPRPRCPSVADRPGAEGVRRSCRSPLAFPDEPWRCPPPRSAASRRSRSRRAKAGKTIYPLNIGQPDIPTPREILDRLRAYDERNVAVRSVAGVAGVHRDAARLLLARRPRGRERGDLRHDGRERGDPLRPRRPRGRRRRGARLRAVLHELQRLRGADRRRPRPGHDPRGGRLPPAAARGDRGEDRSEDPRDPDLLPEQPDGHGVHRRGDGAASARSAATAGST